MEKEDQFEHILFEAERKLSACDHKIRDNRVLLKELREKKEEQRLRKCFYRRRGMFLLVLLAGYYSILMILWSIVFNS